MNVIQSTTNQQQINNKKIQQKTITKKNNKNSNLPAYLNNDQLRSNGDQKWRAKYDHNNNLRIM